MNFRAMGSHRKITIILKKKGGGEFFRIKKEIYNIFYSINLHSVSLTIGNWQEVRFHVADLTGLESRKFQEDYANNSSMNESRSVKGN